MNSRLISGLAIAAILATTGAANAAHVPLTKFRYSDATSFAPMHRARTKAGSATGPNIADAPIVGVTTNDCYGVGGGDLPSAALLGALFAPVANSITPVVGGHDFSAALRGSRSRNWNSRWPDSATTDPHDSPTNFDTIPALRPGNSHVASHFANMLLNATGSNTGTRKLAGKWRKTALGAYPVIEAEMPSSAMPPCTTPPETTPPETTPSETTPSETTAPDTTAPDTMATDITSLDTTPLDTTPPGSYPPDSYPTDSYPPGWNALDLSPLDPFFLDLPPAESMILDVTEPEMTSLEESSLLQSSPNAIPEPGPIALLAIGLGALASVRRRHTFG